MSKTKIHLEKKDMLFLIFISLAYSLVSSAAWIFFGTEILIFLLTLLLFIMLIFFFENYRRTLFNFKEQEKSYCQIESLFSLFSFLKINRPLPLMRGWAISPDFANIIVDQIKQYKPKVIVDLGSGMSTLISGYLLKEQGYGKVFAFDHDEKFVQTTRQMIIKHGVDDAVEIIHAPIKEIILNNKTFLYYDIDKFANLKNIDILIVDGPPERIQKFARYPALPALFNKLSSRAIILVDDAVGVDIREAVKKWQDEFKNLESSYIETEKGAYLIKINK
jgi:hypothetical protein